MIQSNEYPLSEHWSIHILTGINYHFYKGFVDQSDKLGYYLTYYTQSNTLGHKPAYI